MRALIVAPRFIQNYGQYYDFPLGLAYIAASLKKAGHDVFGLNLNHKFGDIADLVADCVTHNKIEVCATGGLSPFLSKVCDVFDGARRANPQIINIAGGGVVSSDPEIAPDLMDMDVGIVGEGEFSIVDVLSAYEADEPLSAVKGIVFRGEDGKTVRTPNRPAVMDLAEIPWPDYDVLDVNEYLNLQGTLDHYISQGDKNPRPRLLTMISSRSCPFACTFCFHPVGKVYRERPLDEFFAELKSLIERYQITAVSICDELFSLRKDRLLEFCERIKPMNVKWSVQLHVNSVNDETMQAMHDSGCTVISFGIESMSQTVLDSMQKKAKKEKIESALSLAMQYKVGIQGNVIFGDSAETLETANETMQWWAHNQRYHVALSRLQVFPGSPDYIVAVRDGLIEDRIAFSKELPTRLNIANMNEKNLIHLTSQAFMQRHTVKRIPRKFSMRVSKEQIIGRDIAYDIDWQCPDCSYDNEYRGCVFGKGHEQFVYLHCQDCRVRIDVPNMKSNRERAFIPLDKIPEALGEDGNVQRSAYFITRHAAYVERNLKMEAKSGKGMATILSVTDEATGALSALPEGPNDLGYHPRDIFNEIHSDPLNPLKHYNMGRVFVSIKAYGAALLHIEQAVYLAPNHNGFKERLAELRKRDDFAEHEMKFFISMSDDPPPYRASRETEMYNRKKEPPFPVYSRAGNRKSVAETEQAAS